MDFLLNNWDELATIAAAVVGVASALTALVRRVSRITPNEADDEFASSMTRFVGKLQKVLDRLSLNPDSNGARRPKEKAK